METVRSLVVMVSKLSSDVQRLRTENKTLKTQLRRLQQEPSHVPSIRREAASSAVANKATAKSYRNVVRIVGGNPGATVLTAPARNIVTGENFSDDDFVTVVRTKRVSSSLVKISAIAN
jgi:hypothetical protein